MPFITLNQKTRIAFAAGTALLALSIAGVPAFAQASDPEAMERWIDIPAGPLGQSVLALSEAYGIQVLVPNDLIAGKRAAPLSGTFSASVALVRLFEDANLKAERLPNGNYVVSVRAAQKRSAREEAPAADVILVDTITVTGEKIDRTLQETVSSVAVFDEETIDTQNFVDLFDLINQTANVAGIGDDTGFSIRGLRNVGAGFGAITSDVATVYLDGVFLPSGLFASSPLNLWDIESVEIFRGPQSTIQGRNALIGAVVARTVDPGSEYSGKAQFRYGEFNSLRGSAALTAPILRDQVSLRLASDYTETEGFVENLNLDEDDAAGRKALTARAKLLITPDAVPRLTARLNFTYSDVDEQTAFIAEGLFPEQRVTFQDERNIDQSETFLTSAEIDYALTDRLSVTSVSAFIDTDRAGASDLDRGPSVSPSNATSIGRDRIFSQELRFFYDGDRLDFILGGYYFNSDNTTRQGSSVFRPSGVLVPAPEILARLLLMTPTPNPAQVAQANALRNRLIAAVPTTGVDTRFLQNNDIENVAVFGEATYAVTDRLTFTFGGRFDSENIDQSPAFAVQIIPTPPTGDPAVDTLIGLLATGFSSETDLQATNDFNAFLPKGVITYDWTDDLSTSISVQRAYRAGGLSFNQLRINVAGALQGVETQEELERLGVVNRFDPEFTMNYEFSLRSQWFDRRLTVNANAYYIDYNDQQVGVVLSSNPSDLLTANVGNSRLFGFELETFARPFDGLDIFANVGFADTKFLDNANILDVIGRDIVDTGDVDLSNDLVGARFANSPRWTGGLGGRYTHSTGLFANMRLRYTGRSFSSVFNEPSSVNDRFVIADMIIGYTQDRYAIELFGDNLFNNDYLTFNPRGELEDGSVAFAIAGPPRVLGVRVTANF
ncbi:TonB-dependent receptor domain-containing protein [Eilatimonas milleporae]|uniref:Outer membrane receptor protein involved in Fe transport n=1 Tax=Eilatimonas milleporae TaxID=911205 RepID=A0A3M0CF33_9PROT|nr:TonB-dependent receptor [Eilatimonas milleporae]RMB07615.1 outer membrane receptor protein involved in Fe transport [Eilatimonas milleporae]